VSRSSSRAFLSTGVLGGLSGALKPLGSLLTLVGEGFAPPLSAKLLLQLPSVAACSLVGGVPFRVTSREGWLRGLVPKLGVTRRRMERFGVLCEAGPCVPAVISSMRRAFVEIDGGGSLDPSLVPDVEVGNTALEGSKLEALDVRSGVSVCASAAQLKPLGGLRNPLMKPLLWAVSVTASPIFCESSRPWRWWAWTIFTARGVSSWTTLGSVRLTTRSKLRGENMSCMLSSMYCSSAAPSSF